MFQNLAIYAEGELYANIGPFQHIVKLPVELNTYLEDARSGKNKILNGSFLHRHFYPTNQNHILNFIINNA